MYAMSTGGKKGKKGREGGREGGREEGGHVKTRFWRWDLVANGHCVHA